MSLFKNRILTVILAACLMISSVPVFAAENHSDNEVADEYQVTANENELTYSEYIKNLEKFSEDANTLHIEAESALLKNSQVLKDFSNVSTPVVLMQDDSFAEFTINIPQDALYNIKIRYAIHSDNKSAVEQTMLLDGGKPFDEAGYVIYNRTFEEERKGQKDVSGNDVVPTSKEVSSWKTLTVSDSTYYIQEPFCFALKEGVHTISFTGVSGKLVIDYIELVAPQKSITYSEYLAQHSDKDVAKITPIEIEAEDYSAKSAVTIIPSTDRSSSSTTPQDAKNLRLNSVGGTRWSEPGQSISWTVNVPSDGMYSLSLRYKQSEVDGIFVSRKLYIDGVIPFSEVEAIRFPYGKRWDTMTLGDGSEDYLFYLSAGEHIITFEAVLGDVGEILGEINDSLVELNTLYREILMVTGPSPDRYRDYNFKESIPDVIEGFGEQHEKLVAVRDEIEDITGSNSSYISILNTLIYELDLLHNDPVKIATHLDLYKSNLGSLGTWLLSATAQPLLFDKITVFGEEKTETKESNFFENILFNIKCFLFSFIQDYEHIGQTSTIETDRSITVWLPSGRDQAQIVRRLIDNNFAQEKNIQVNLQLVAASNLLPSVLAGIGPDIAMGNTMETPVNYAVRNAVVDLSGIDGFDEVASRFYSESLVPYSYNGGVYALPESLTFPMLFYRTDIFEELSLKVPTTWDEFLALIPILQSQNMNIAIPTGLNGYTMILYKNGGRLYRDGGAESALDEEVALSSFQEFSELFTMYQLPVSYDFANRFRTGEIPCGIQSYDMYNKLSVFAPEIKGMWDFVPMPSVTDANGNERNISIVNGTAIMIMNSAKDIKACWEFLDWWTDDVTQSRFGIEMESILGTSAKYATANRTALENMNWTGAQVKNLQTQISRIAAYEQVPGGYYTSRVISFAFNEAYSNLSDPVEDLENYIEELNEELYRKREEFNLNTKK